MLLFQAVQATGQMCSVQKRAEKSRKEGFKHVLLQNAVSEEFSSLVSLRKLVTALSEG